VARQNFGEDYNRLGVIEGKTMLTFQEYKEYLNCRRCDLAQVVECYDCGMDLINFLWADANPKCPNCGYSLDLLDQAC
jgi:hypothetical protein